jgi:hypothetical protein
MRDSDEIPEEDWEGMEDYDQTTPCNGHAFEDDPTDEDALDWEDEPDDEQD